VCDAESSETALYGGGVKTLPFLGDETSQFMRVGRHVTTPFAEGPEIGLIGPAGVLRMRLPDQFPDGLGKLVFLFLDPSEIGHFLAPIRGGYRR
jgi:hypothetical protein